MPEMLHYTYIFELVQYLPSWNSGLILSALPCFFNEAHNEFPNITNAIILES